MKTTRVGRNVSALDSTSQMRIQRGFAKFAMKHARLVMALLQTAARAADCKCRSSKTALWPMLFTFTTQATTAV